MSRVELKKKFCLEDPAFPCSLFSLYKEALFKLGEDKKRMGVQGVLCRLLYLGVLCLEDPAFS